MPDSEIMLYRHVGCPYCERVVRALTARNVRFRSRFVSPAHSERGHVKQVSGSRTVPVLVDDEKGIVMSESANILAYVEATYGNDPVEDALATELPPTDHPTEGETAPDFTRPLVNAEFWEDVALSELVDGEHLVVVFYPMDGTGAASYTWIELRDRGFDENRLVGLSISTPYEHRRFIERHELPYRLYSDPGNGVAETYDVVHDQGGMAGLSGARPAVFVVRPDMTVGYSWVAQEWPDFPPFDELEAAVDQSSS